MKSTFDEVHNAINSSAFFKEVLSGSTRTLEDIGNDFDLTKERVRQIKEKALRKLRNETAILFEYL